MPDKPTEIVLLKCNELGVMYMGEDAKSSVCRLIQYYALNKHDDTVYFGKDEFPTEDSIRDLIHVSDSFTVTDRATSVCYGYVLLTQTIFLESPYADVRVIPKETKQEEGQFETLLNVAVELASQLKYEACYFETFLLNIKLLEMLRMKGFNVVFIAPRGGYVHGQGWQDNVVLLKEIKCIQVLL